MHKGQIDNALREDGSYAFPTYFKEILHLTKAPDLAVANMEFTLAGPPYSGYPCFSAPDSYAKALKDAGFDMFLTANNHCLDRRDKGARRTLVGLDSLGVDHIGTYADVADRQKKVPFIKNINGIKFGFLNYTYGTNGIEPKDGIEVALINKPKRSH